MNGTKNILMIEDNPADIRLTQEAFRENGIHHTLHVVKDGVEAMAYVRRENQYTGAERPDLILLDLNLPRKDGRQFLAEIKADALLRRIPVVILTTSQAETDINHCYDHHANCYMVKPVNLEDFIATIRQIEGFWLGAVVLPELP